MKKLVIITLGAVFALSLVSGIASEKGKPDPSVLLCAPALTHPVYCDYEKVLVKLACVHPNGNTTFIVWSDDPELFTSWCE